MAARFFARFGKNNNFMSRIAKKPILIPAGVEVKIEGQKAIVKSQKGEIQKDIRPEVKVEIKDGQIFVTSKIETKRTKSFLGLTRALLANMVKGLTEGYERKLEIEGLGFRAALEGADLTLNLGFSHPVKIKAPEGIKFSVEKNVISVSGVNKELVSQTAANIRKVRPPEPYKGKGIRYAGEVVRRKVGKKAVATK